MFYRTIYLVFLACFLSSDIRSTAYLVPDSPLVVDYLFSAMHSMYVTLVVLVFRATQCISLCSQAMYPIDVAVKVGVMVQFDTA